MNPPSALAGAMSRDRKPFTYTPGGLDLSEIKSEKMAKRLMRNAMNQGLPERPQQIQSPPTPTTPVAVPNFNCLPVQVFPTFNLPANPKSLLRTRSVPSQPREPILERGPPPQIVNNIKPMPAPQLDVFNINIPTYSQINNNRPASMYEPSSSDSSPMNYGSSGHTAAFTDSSYNVPEYMRVQPNAPTVNTNTPLLPTLQNEYGFNNNYILPKVNDTVSTPEVVSPVTFMDNNINKINKEAEVFVSTPEIVQKPEQEDHASTDQREVKVTQKQVKQETSVKETNGTQNGDAETEAEMTVKLPAKKSAAKTETQVDVSKKTLPDGSVEEVKITTTKTTIDGKTEIRTRTEKRLIPKEDDDEEEEIVEEEDEEGEDVEVQEVKEKEVKQPETTVVIQNKENGRTSVIKTAESSETTTTSTKKVVIVEDNKEREEEVEEEDVEEEIEAEPVTFVIKKAAEKTPTPTEDDKEELEEEEPVEIVEVKETKVEEIVLNSSENAKEGIEEDIEEDIEPQEEVKKEETSENKVEEDEEVEEEDQYEEAEETEEKVEVKIKEDRETEVEKYGESVNDEKIETKEQNVDEVTEESIVVKESEELNNSKTEVAEQQITEEKQEVTVESQEVKSEKPEIVKEVILTPKIETSDNKPSFREPSVPLEKVEDVEIRPLSAGDFTKTHTHSTEIITNPDLPSVVTKYNRTETIETVKRTIETLDPTPPLSYFTPHVEKVMSPQIQRPYQPVYPPEPTAERRHSLLLERLSMERQLPTDVYQNSSSYSTQTTEQQQFTQEPQAEILEVANVKPSTITNQEWFQQTKKDVHYNNSTPVAQSTPPIWVQQKSQPQTQPIYSPQPQYQPQSPQPQYQSKLSPQPQYQRQPSPQPQFQQPSPLPQYQPSPQPQYQQPSPQPQYQQPSPQPQYQPTYSNSTQQTTSSTQYSSYPSKPSTFTPGANYETNTQTNQFSSYQNSKQYSSSYVPPPWEQDNTYVTETSQNYYQPPPQTPFSPTPNQSWKPPPGKFSKSTPTAYIPPKPNQSFVKPVTSTDIPRIAGRKTYYSEYERRYISVPESTYIPGETKFQAQPDPSPQYYYDNNEPEEHVEHQWRKELREFTEKSQTQTQSSMNPPWESEKSFAKTPEAYTQTPTWSQKVRPQSWRERSFESQEFASQEWPKTNTLGRGRPLSSYGKETIPERIRGVSVDRYNPNSYQSPLPAEHPPVQTFTHNPPAPHATGYHNPHVPAYHGRASAEPREQPAYQQPRAWRQPQPSPVQSRSFKYLQWITGTDD